MLTASEWAEAHRGELRTMDSKHGCPEIACMKCGSRAHIENEEAITMDDGDGTCDSMKTYQVWVEGYRATGEHGPHWLKGEVEADSFEEACDIIFKDDAYYDTERRSYWGCRLFDNAADAAEGFG